MSYHAMSENRKREMMREIENELVFHIDVSSRLYFTLLVPCGNVLFFLFAIILGMLICSLFVAQNRHYEMCNQSNKQ